jgi:hypothetical protein
MSSLGLLAVEYPRQPLSFTDRDTTAPTTDPSWTLTTSISQAFSLSQNRHLSDQLLLLVRHFFPLMERLLTSIKWSLAQSGHICTGSISRGGQDNRRLWHRSWLTANMSSTKTAEETYVITYMMKTRSQRKRIFPRRLCSESHRYAAHSVISISERNYIRVFGM